MTLRPRKSSSKCLEAMFQGAETATAVTGQDRTKKSRSSEVQRSSTPIDLNDNELNHPPVSSR